MEEKQTKPVENTTVTDEQMDEVAGGAPFSSTQLFCGCGAETVIRDGRRVCSKCGMPCGLIVP